VRRDRYIVYTAGLGVHTPPSLRRSRQRSAIRTMKGAWCARAVRPELLGSLRRMGRAPEVPSESVSGFFGVLNN
jgi:hypothetical protein